jgi:hypothetical protein
MSGRSAHHELERLLRAVEKIRDQAYSAVNEINCSLFLSDTTLGCSARCEVMGCSAAIIPPTAIDFIHFLRYICWCRLGIILLCDATSLKIEGFLWIDDMKEEIGKQANCYITNKYQHRERALQNNLFPIVKDASNYLIHRLMIEKIVERDKDCRRALEERTLAVIKERVSKVGLQDEVARVILDPQQSNRQRRNRQRLWQVSYKKCVDYSLLQTVIGQAIETHIAKFQTSELYNQRKKIGLTSNDLIEVFR